VTISTGFWVRNYKSFKQVGGGVGCIKFVNLIVGKNNIGKSSFVDVVDYLADGTKAVPALANSLTLTDSFSESELQSVFRRNTSGGDLSGNHWNNHGKNFVGVRVEWDYKGTRSQVLLSNLVNEVYSRYLNPFVSGRAPFGARYCSIRLAADRDLVPEKASDKPAIDSNGVGATNVIQMYINHAELDRSIVQSRLLIALNEIFYPDVRFAEIIVQFHKDAQTWEVF